MTTAIIGGTGFYSLGIQAEEQMVPTPYGNVTVYRAGLAQGPDDILFLPRHGSKHQLPPHRIPYRANMYALKKLGATHILASCAVGSVSAGIKPGDFVILTDFIDTTRLRNQTFYDNETDEFPGVLHTEMSEPYCSVLRNLLEDAFFTRQEPVHKNGIYLCTDGPRFETASEIKMYQQAGADIIGMTNVPEVVLAKELGLCYSAVGLVTNWCTGMNQETIKIEEILDLMKQQKELLSRVFLDVAATELSQDHCQCRSAAFTM
jgi:5'-methylthioadenosine phosphorylase